MATITKRQASGNRADVAILQPFADGGAFIAALDANHGDAGKAFVEAGRAQLGCHVAHGLFRDHALAAAIAIEADFQRHFEEHGVDFVAEFARHLDPVAALAGRKIGGVHIIPGHARDHAGAQDGTKRGKHQVLVALLGDVVEQDGAQQVARQRRHATTLEPSALARARQADRQHDYAARRLSSGGWRWGRNFRSER